MPKKKATKVNKITIYAPKHRLKEIERWRDEMNFSGLFWSAFDREVAALSVTKNRKQEMMKVVERLKREASEDFETGREMGAEWGAAWAKDRAGRDDLRAVGEGRLTFEDERVIDFMVRKYDYKPDDYEREFGEEPYQVAPPMNIETFETGFAAGFNEGAHQIWSGIRHEFE